MSLRVVKSTEVKAKEMCSIPARFGVPQSLLIARLLHAGALAALAAVGRLADLHPVYWLGWLMIAAILVREHRVVRADDLSRIGVAFLNMNAIISVIYLATVLAAAILPH